MRAYGNEVRHAPVGDILLGMARTWRLRQRPLRLGDPSWFTACELRGGRAANDPDTDHGAFQSSHELRLAKNKALGSIEQNGTPGPFRNGLGAILRLTKQAAPEPGPTLNRALADQWARFFSMWSSTTSGLMFCFTS